MGRGGRGGWVERGWFECIVEGELGPGADIADQGSSFFRVGDRLSRNWGISIDSSFVSI